MGRVQLEIPPWVASMLNTPSSNWLILKKEIGEEATVGNLLAELALDSPEFRKAVFDPDTDKSSQPDPEEAISPTKIYSGGIWHE